MGKRYGAWLRCMDDVFDETPATERCQDEALRGQIARLALEACRRGDISRGRLLELGRKLDIPVDVLLDLAGAVRGD